MLQVATTQGITETLEIKSLADRQLHMIVYNILRAHIPHSEMGFLRKIIVILIVVRALLDIYRNSLHSHQGFKVSISFQRNAILIVTHLDNCVPSSYLRVFLPSVVYFDDVFSFTFVHL